MEMVGMEMVGMEMEGMVMVVMGSHHMNPC
jgi:hypothetical protein